MHALQPFCRRINLINQALEYHFSGDWYGAYKTEFWDLWLAPQYLVHPKYQCSRLPKHSQDSGDKNHDSAHQIGNDGRLHRRYLR